MGGGAGFTGGTPLKGGGGQLGGSYGQYAPPQAQGPIHRGLGAGVGSDAWIASHPNFHNNFVMNNETKTWQHRANPIQSQPTQGAPTAWGYQPQPGIGMTPGQNDIAQIYQQMFGGGWGGGLGPFKLY